MFKFLKVNMLEYLVDGWSINIVLNVLIYYFILCFLWFVVKYMENNLVICDFKKGLNVII